ncbi:MAG: SMI1/KNR4 family protein [Parvibaculaceae bacterium]
MQSYREKFGNLKFGSPATARDVFDLSTRLCTVLPACYRAFLLEANGAVGFTSSEEEAHYVDLWSFDRVESVPQGKGHLPGIIIGSNGAGEGICLTALDERTVYGLLPFVGPLKNDFIPVSDTLFGFLLCPNWFEADYGV